MAEIIVGYFITVPQKDNYSILLLFFSNKADSVSNYGVHV